MPLRKVKVTALQVGMYVIMPTSWGDHPFLKNKFCLDSQAQIDKIIKAGLTEVLIDTEKSDFDGSMPAGDVKTFGKEGPSIVPDALREAIQDRSLSAQERSRIVRDNALVMMDNLLSRPTERNIREVKKAIAEIVELILTDDETATYLTKIGNYDHYTYTHSVNVGFLAVSLAKILFRGSNAHDMHELGAGFFLHDLGKVRIDEAIINKRGPLSRDEMKEMRKHPSVGYMILYEARQLTEESKIIVLQHHERYDGQGYPGQLRDKEIHTYGKICAIADVYDALTSDRPYREKMSSFLALATMKNEMMNHFQKDLFGAFVVMLS